MTPRRLHRIVAAIRAADWWLYKIPPLATIGYASACLDAAAPWAHLRAAGAAILGVCLVAVYGYVLNDLCDIDEDRLSGRPNRMAALSAPMRTVALLVPIAALGLLAWTLDDAVTTTLYATNLALPTLYSVKPVRLKVRGIFGAFADASGVHAVPAAIVAHAASAGLGSTVRLWLIASSVAWAFLSGFRGIILHQIADRHADHEAQVETFGAQLGVARARSIVLGLLLPLEAISLAIFLVITLRHAPVAAVILMLYATGEVVKIRLDWKLPLFDPPSQSTERYLPLINNELAEVWAPLGFALQLAVSYGWAWLLVVAAHATLFWPNIVERTRWMWRTVQEQRAETEAHARLERRRTRHLESPLPPVVIAATSWTVNGVNIFSGNLARGLLDVGASAHIFITEEDSNLVRYDERRLARPAGVRFEPLDVAPYDGWGMHWAATQRYLEAAAPCIYIPNSDWRHSCVCPLLSDRVVTVGVVHSDDALHYDHVRRLGPYWNAIVCVSQTVADKTIAESPSLADRVVTIPIGVRIPIHPTERARTVGPLRVVYHGILKQHQKRVLDLPKIVAAAIARGVPIQLSIAGAGPDEAALRAAAAPLVEQGYITFLGLLPPEAIGPLLEAHDVYLLASEFEGMPNALIEAMGRGCVPIVTRMKSGIPELIASGRNGYLVPIGDARAFAECLYTLWDDPGHRAAMSARAFQSVSRGRFRVEDMVEAYEDVFARAWSDAKSGRFVRPKGLISPPPATVAGVSLFPIAMTHNEPSVGPFPSEDDAEDYLRLMAQPAGQPSRRTSVTAEELGDITVWVSAPVWTENGVNRWSEDLVRGLRGAGLNAKLLITEENTILVQIPGPRFERAPDIPFHELTPTGPDGWGARWGAMTHLLESSAPCIYLPNFDWRHAAVVPALSDRIGVIGVLHDAGPLYLSQAERQSAAWDAAVGIDRHVTRDLVHSIPGLADRTTTIPYLPDVPSTYEWRPKPADRTPRVLVLGHDPDAAEMLARAIRALTNSRSPVRVVLGDSCAALDALLPDVPVERHSDLARFEWLTLCQDMDFILMCGGSGVLWRLMIEAMGRGIIPLMIGGDHNSAYLVRDQETGIVVSADQIETVADRVAAVIASPENWERLAMRAHGVAKRDGPTQEQMIETYVELIRSLRPRLTDGHTRRPRPHVAPPPAWVGETSILPVTLQHESAIGRFPTDEDAQRYLAESVPPAVDGTAVASAVPATLPIAVSEDRLSS